jgi:hypothetical protein
MYQSKIFVYGLGVLYHGLGPEVDLWHGKKIILIM